MILVISIGFIIFQHYFLMQSEMIKIQQLKVIDSNSYYVE